MKMHLEKVCRSMIQSAKSHSTSDTKLYSNTS